jgi:hypothetical protein
MTATRSLTRKLSADGTMWLAKGRSVVYVGPGPGTWPPTPGTYDPGATTTGVRPGTALTDVAGSGGTITVTGSGAGLTTITGKRYNCWLVANAAAGKIKFSNCEFHGYSNATTNTALAKTTYAGAVDSVTFEDCTFVPAYPSYWCDAIMGGSFTARRCNIYGTVDGIGIQGDNTLMETSWIHDHSYFSPDPNHSDNQTHNDAAQHFYGTNCEIRYSNLAGWTSTNQGNTAIFIRHSAGYPDTANISIHDNLLDGGSACLHAYTTSADQAAGLNCITNLSIVNNRFGPHAGTSGRVIYVASCIPGVTISGNTMAADGSPAPIVRFSS